MNYLQAALTILDEAQEPLHYAEITRRALHRQLLAPTGLTPDATMGSLADVPKQPEANLAAR